MSKTTPLLLNVAKNLTEIAETEAKKTIEKPLCANPRSICVDCVKRQNCQYADTGVYIGKCEEFENG